MMMRAFEAIILDFDGVIADSEGLHLRAYQDVLAPLDLPLADETYYSQYLGYDDAGVFRRYGQNQGLSWDEHTIKGLIEAKAGRYKELSRRSEMLLPGAAAFIRTAAKAVPLAIASGALTDEIDDILERAGLSPFFVAVVGADQTMRSKPSPDPYLEAFHRVAIAGHAADRSRTVAIEDSRWGLVSAGTAGLRCVAVTNTYTADELAPYAELVVAGLDALTLDALDALVDGRSVVIGGASGRRLRES